MIGLILISFITLQTFHYILHISQIVYVIIVILLFLLEYFIILFSILLISSSLFSIHATFLFLLCTEHWNRTPPECVRFVGRENLTLKEQRGWHLTEYTVQLRTTCVSEKSCKLKWQVGSHYLWRNPKALASQQAQTNRGNYKIKPFVSSFIRLLNY